MSILWQPPQREISLTRGNNRDYVFTFEDLNTPTIPNFSGEPNQPQHTLYDFPDGTEFKFRAKDDQYDIVKTGTWNETTKEIKISFLAADTVNITRDRRIHYELDAIFPDDARYTLLVGDLVIFATKNLNG